MKQMLYQAIKRVRLNNDGYDEALLWCVLLLVSVGLVMVYSASIAKPRWTRIQASVRPIFLKCYLIFLLIGGMGAFAAFSVPTRVWQKNAPRLPIAGVVLLALVLIPGIGREVNAPALVVAGRDQLQPSALAEEAAAVMRQITRCGKPAACRRISWKASSRC